MRISLFILCTLFIFPIGIYIYICRKVVMNSLILKKIYPYHTHFVFITIYVVVRGKSFLVETETEEDEATVDVSAGYDESNESGFRRALRPQSQNKCITSGGGWGNCG